MNDRDPARQPVLAAGLRTPFLKSGGAYAALRGHELAAAAMAELADRHGLREKNLGMVALGMVVQDVDATNAAREAMLRAGLSPRTPAFTVSMAGISPNLGLTTICDRIRLGRLDRALACGADNFSDLPVRFGPNLRKRAVRLATSRSTWQRLRVLAGIRPGDLVPRVPSALDQATGLTMGEATERMARRFRVTREASDSFALRSHRLADQAWAEGRYEADVMAIDLPGGSRIQRDDSIRPDTSAERLAALTPSFDESGVVTAGNASGLTDGAGALLITSAAVAEQDGLEPLAAIVDHELTGVANMKDEMLLGPAAAIPPLLARNGLAMGDVDVFELHEAFAAQVLANQAALADPHLSDSLAHLAGAPGAIPEEQLNGWGGSLALGNPFGATGIRLLLTASHRLRAGGGRYAVVASCAGGGLGGAFLLGQPGY